MRGKRDESDGRKRDGERGETKIPEAKKKSTKERDGRVQQGDIKKE